MEVGKARTSGPRTSQAAAAAVPVAPEEAGPSHGRSAKKLSMQDVAGSIKADKQNLRVEELDVSVLFMKWYLRSGILLLVLQHFAHYPLGQICAWHPITRCIASLEWSLRC